MLVAHKPVEYSDLQYKKTSKKWQLSPSRDIWRMTE